MRIPALHLICGFVALHASLGFVVAADDGVEFFERSIRPVLIERCYECHGEKKQKGGLRLDSREAVLKGGESGPGIVPGKPDESLLIKAVRYEDKDLAMPPKTKGGKLTDVQIQALVHWVKIGAPDPRTATDAPPAAKVPGVDHWAFTSPQRPSVPKLPGAEPPNAIDSFLRERIKAAGLVPALPADARTLIRRATFDLHGLPPTAEEVATFERDAASDAWPRLVDRLLASPRYGERWGRHWLDLARYSDTKGYIYPDRMEKRFVQSAPYRDWVIRALNEDMPYDRFLMLQIAADQMGCAPADLAATGFLTVGRWLLGVMPDIIDDRIDTLTRATQALTVSCARCHDHKYDPIPTKDYYSLYGVIAGCTESLTPISPIATSSKEFQEGLSKRREELGTAMRKARDELAARVRNRTADYLAAQPSVDELPGEEVYLILQPDELIPAVARRWQAYLTTQRAHALWTAWFAFAALPEAEFSAKAPDVFNEVKAAPTARVNPRLAEALGERPPGKLREVADAYAKAFAAVPEKPAEGESPEVAPLRDFLFSANSPCLPPDVPLRELSWYLPEKDRVALGKLEAEIERWIIEAPDAVPHAVHLADRAELRNPRVFRRGNASNRGVEVPRQYLEIIEGVNRRPFQHGSGRLELAKIIASRENPLTARVMVNRVWQQHFGDGLVRTPSDFGTRGDAPTHPELLDWLSLEFMEQGWLLKKLHRLILLSEAYCRSSEADAAALTADAENKLFARQKRGRLDFEGLRDSLLFVSGELDLRAGGRADPMFGEVFSPRRTIYGYLDRQFVPAEMTAFDMASADIHTAKRHETTVAPQALLLMNGQFIAARARALVAELGETPPAPADRVRAIYQRLFQREPTAREIERGVTFTSRGGGAGVPPTVSAGVTARNGAWHRNGDELWQTSTDRDVGLFFGDSSWTDYTVEVEARRDHGDGGPQLAVRVNGEREMYWAYFGSYGGHRHGAERESGDKLESVGPPGPAGALEPGRWYRLKVEVSGEDVRCFLDGEKVYEFKDKQHASGRIGIGSWASTLRYRNLKVTDKEQQLLFAGLPEPPRGPLTAWERYAQVLLLSNEFSFID